MSTSERCSYCSRPLGLGEGTQRKTKHTAPYSGGLTDLPEVEVAVCLECAPMVDSRDCKGLAERAAKLNGGRENDYFMVFKGMLGSHA